MSTLLMALQLLFASEMSLAKKTDVNESTILQQNLLIYDSH